MLTAETTTIRPFLDWGRHLKPAGGHGLPVVV
jgi:hypothetical protein